MGMGTRFGFGAWVESHPILRHLKAKASYPVFGARRLRPMLNKPAGNASPEGVPLVLR
jgi:hypothetical protein